LNEDWLDVVERLGGAAALTRSAREARAFLRPREVKSAVDLLRLVLAYCLGRNGLRLTAAWAAAVGLVDLSNVALLYRLRQCGDWLALLVSGVLADATPRPGANRLIRIVDATSVLKAGQAAKRGNRLWRVHAAFDVPHERFGWVELTDERGGERFDRMPVVKGEIRIGDGAYLQPDRIATVLEGGGDVLVRAGWRNTRWLDADGEPVDLLGVFQQAQGEPIDRPIWVRRQRGPALALRLIAVPLSEQAAAAARRKARRQAAKEGYQLSQGALIAADWFILLTSLEVAEFSLDDILALYRLRWRVELAFKRLKSLIGLRRPPGTDPRSARPYLLAHLLLLLLLEPLVDALEDSPRWANAA
jgi:hypothetical protein